MEPRYTPIVRDKKYVWVDTVVVDKLELRYDHKGTYDDINQEQ